ncbi:hypothetical protein A2V68_02340 [candidate division Kazan bacterium RBG_13_50_9]|uniref:Isoleucine--tRNA ligase n=1 Tax=candidate division Kazan bacterium RBG_13_50_9 TaxID=1798535 RepID=A0A1F4NRL9_UNCK3|nr:MAG: hypothetical protein A2V68_02340 [candidate division Kazan bacterium RBG_13_50_9]
MARFGKVDPKLNLPKEELKVLEFWKKENVFKKSLALRAKGKRYVFFEGPPTANGKPGIHHVLARAFKDLFPRYKTMQGFLVERKAGWDTHGLPVEIEVEKELGLKDKKDIEEYGVDKFNAECRKSVWRYKEDWEKLTERMAFWLDLDDPYVTYDAKYIESLWWIIRQIWDRGLLYEGHKVVPRCTRCGTALSSHEVAQGYREVEENSVFVKFKVKGKDNTYILSWTTTPWTLPGNVALAVSGETKYVAVHEGKDTLILARDLVERAAGQQAVVVREYLGKDLVGWQYEPLFPGAVPEDTPDFSNAFKVYPADFVTTQDGTGVVHTAVMYGEDDYQLGEQVGLPKFHTVSEDGLFLPSVKKWAGRYVKDPKVETSIVEDLREQGLIFKEIPYRHDYPFCWRCDTPLLYYAARSWFIKMSELRAQLIQDNQTINWVPEHIKEGRFGEWLKEVKDWAFSRERFWGTPLPLWRSEEGNLICVGSFDELRALAKDKSKVGDGFDPHKPFVDEVVLVKDGKEYRRVPEIVDVWFDSGSMPFAQWHYPMENRDKVDKGEAYPADFIAEAIDQTRGWFYTLLAVATLLGKEAPYKNVICFGLLMDKHGKKMSKRLGNIVDPWQIFGSHGADVLRWYLYTVNHPGLPKNFDEDGLTQVTRRFVLTLWNTLSFFVTYAELDNFKPAGGASKVSGKLDQWILARLYQTVADVTESLDSYDVMNAAGQIERLTNDLSNWYVRRSRKRFWKSEDTADKQRAYQTLYMVLRTTAILLAPFMPMLAEAIYQALRGDKDPISVHLEDWPKAGGVDAPLLAQMRLARELVEAGHALREEAGIKVRQPLAMFAIDSPDDLPDELKEIIRDELNIKRLVWDAQKKELDKKITPQLEQEGMAREVVRSVQALRKSSGLSVSDRIQLFYESEDRLVQDSIAVWVEYIKGETLARELIHGTTEIVQEVMVDGHKVKLGIKKI